jgi:hypothetical protein
MLLFNEAMNNLGILELPLKGRKYTWIDMQKHPLMEKFDWFFTSSSWTSSYPNTIAYPMVKPTSDHTPCVISIGTKIPKARIFRFENFWLQHSVLNKLFKILRKSLWVMETVQRE